ncbi:MAG: PIN domain-containing protein [Chloroflexi bacterium]|nr:PIN domain-containing protein [Chloroflexota bacterium]MCI0649030.1 PIN domain-containing protein [Chloroflexota bacterium]
MIFVDTSALYALLDADSEDHDRVRQQWESLVTSGEPMICTNYVLVETSALVQHRLGMAAVRTLQEDVLPILAVSWVEEAIHQAGTAALLAANRRQLSLVDCVSFVAARNLGINTVFGLDRHFVEQGFICIP